MPHAPKDDEESTILRDKLQPVSTNHHKPPTHDDLYRENTRQWQLRQKEQNIVKLQEKKHALADQILSGEDMGSGSFSREEILELLGGK